MTHDTGLREYHLLKLKNGGAIRHALQPHTESSSTDVDRKAETHFGTCQSTIDA